MTAISTFQAVFDITDRVGNYTPDFMVAGRHSLGLVFALGFKHLAAMVLFENYAVCLLILPYLNARS